MVLPSPKMGKKAPSVDLTRMKNDAFATQQPPPEPQGGNKTRIIAESGLRIGKHAGVKLRLAVCQTLEDECQHQHATAGNAPRDGRPQNAGGSPECGWQGKNTGTNHRSDNQRDKSPQREFMC